MMGRWCCCGLLLCSNACGICMLDNAGGYLLCMLVGIRSACWWVSALYAPMLVAYLLCTVLDNAGGGICMLDKAPCCTMPQCTMLHAGGYLLCTLVGTCSACSNAGGTSALHCAAPCWTKHDFPPKPQKQKHLHTKSASQGYCTQTPSTRQH